ncbi:MAG: hypothetical protein AAGA31_04555, partial [Bacteroidota bacterium]
GGKEVSLSLIDGIQNIVPYGVGSELQNRSSNLVDAYKRNELDAVSGLGIFALSAIIVDKAEPSEALKANVAWSLGFENPEYLLSSLQLAAFRAGESIHGETDIKGEKGAYFLHQTLDLPPQTKKEWTIVANVNQDHAAVAQLIKELSAPQALLEKLAVDIALGTKKLIGLSAAADGLQMTADDMRDTRHFSNTLFNIMRGGIFDDNYVIEKGDFTNYLAKANKQVIKDHQQLLSDLPTATSLATIKEMAAASSDPDFRRLCLEYLPLKFSRRHGDPSRPWNRFSINTHSEVDGSKILDYEGNWRDIFQNWEALAYAYPGFMEGMILKFVNATTFDGYNPYRVTKDGFDWETIEADDPWSYIGYWGDHQIIYLLKFLEFIEKHQPGKLAEYFEDGCFVYANVPYKIKAYQDILRNPKDTIDFDHQADGKIREQKAKIGADGALLRGQDGEILRVNFMEKILATVLAKMANFIPEGGIWMNTQRPEWNDANNALVGNGVSMVTLYYLRRFLQFFAGLLDKSNLESVAVSEELFVFQARIAETLSKYESLIQGAINDHDRKAVLDGLGEAASDFRTVIYQHAFSGKKKKIALADLRRFSKSCLAHLDHSIAANQRSDNLFHAYNLMTPSKEGVAISYLSEMLEGQVAALSSGNLPPVVVLDVLDALRESKLYREDQNSYILYPNKDLAGFLTKNLIPPSAVAKSTLLRQLVENGDARIVEKDVNGDFHFNGNFKNAGDLKAALGQLAETTYGPLAEQESAILLGIFEEVFNHKEFTGRSGTFFGYEGLGSIYWHMVSKLQLAVQECCLQAIEQGADTSVTQKLIKHYYAINEGIGIHKPPNLYGAFPTDPYSHTPAGKGAQQPGMTGQVKEDILSRIGEFGVTVANGKIAFLPRLLRRSEFLNSPAVFQYVDVSGRVNQLDLPANSLCFTYCQVPVVYTLSEEEGLTIHYREESSKNFEGTALDEPSSEQLFLRTDAIEKIQVRLPAKALR